ncbi:hypothetical protein LTR94_036358, partial [Friedmanniomyces endolithicus]
RDRRHLPHLRRRRRLPLHPARAGPSETGQHRRRADRIRLRRTGHRVVEARLSVEPRGISLPQDPARRRRHRADGDDSEAGQRHA